MASSTLDPDNIPEPDRQLGIGHDNDALGPSDISDSGSDVQGGYRAIEGEDIPLDQGTNEDMDSRNLHSTPGDSDSTGTGETSTSGRNADVDIASDIDVDRIETLDADEDLDLADLDADLGDLPPPSQSGDDSQTQRR